MRLREWVLAPFDSCLRGSGRAISQISSKFLVPRETKCGPDAGRLRRKGNRKPFATRTAELREIAS
jgi:hypothetical protein